MTNDVRKLTSLLRVVIGITFMAVISAVFAVVLIVLLPFRITRIRVCNLYGKILGRFIVAIAGVTPDIPDFARLDDSFPALYVVNHASAMDVFLCIWLAPFGTCGIFKKEITLIPFFGQIAWLSGHLRIDRKNPKRAISSLNEAATFVRAHKLGLLIFPEGTRSHDGRLRPFKHGFVHLALACKLPVVPIIIHGAHRNWARGTLLDIRPRTLRVEVLDPIDTSHWQSDDVSIHAKEVHDLFVSRLDEDQRPTLPA